MSFIVFTLFSTNESLKCIVEKYNLYMWHFFITDQLN